MQDARRPPDHLVSPASAVAPLTSPLRTADPGPSRGDEITDRLITAIAVGEYLPGSRLPSERELAAALQVGRTTVREAISRLVDAGLLVTQRGRTGGSFVSSQWEDSSRDAVSRTLQARWESIRELSEALSLLHGAVARAAATNHTAADVDLLTQRLAAFRAADSGHPSQQADAALHAAISAAAHNAALATILAELERRLSVASPAHPWGPVDRMAAMEARSLADHETLIQAICTGDAVSAEDVARRHVRIDLEIMEEALGRLLPQG